MENARYILEADFLKKVVYMISSVSGQDESQVKLRLSCYNALGNLVTEGIPIR
jgi:hypothetical protein